MASHRIVRVAAPIAIVVAAFTALVLSTSGPPPPTPNPPGTFAFGALGDAPYYPWEDWRYPLMLQDIDGNDLAFSIHVGDIFWRPCSDDRYERSLRWFNGLKHPLIYVPGDNEWADCWTRAGRRLQPSRSTGSVAPHPVSAAGVESGPPDVAARNAVRRIRRLRSSSNMPAGRTAAWCSRRSMWWAAIISPSGSRRGRTPTIRNRSRRLEAALAWLHETFARAKSQSATAIVVSFHADPGFDWSPPSRVPFKPLLDAFEDEAVAFGKPVLLIHGDSHDFKTDFPLKARATQQTIGNVMRLEVPGSPLVGWVRVVVTPGATPSFAFEQRLVPRWKYW